MATAILPLQYVPTATASIHIYLNGIEQYEPSDWTYQPTGNKILVNTPMEALTGDLLEARYAHSHGTAAAETFLGISVNATNSSWESDGGTYVHTLTRAPTVAEVLVVVISTVGGTPSAVAGAGGTWTRVGTVVADRVLDIWIGHGFNGTGNSLTITAAGVGRYSGAVRYLTLTGVPSLLNILTSAGATSGAAGTSPVRTVVSQGNGVVLLCASHSRCNNPLAAVASPTGATFGAPLVVSSCSGERAAWVATGIPDGSPTAGGALSTSDAGGTWQIMAISLQAVT